MTELAIKGHATRGDEVIEILKMLGGKNLNNLDGASNMYYFMGLIVPKILAVGKLELDKSHEQFTYFTLEEFEEKFPYKIGDKVLHNLDIVMLIERMYWDSECNIIRYDIVSQVNEKYKLKGLMAEHLRFYTEQKEESMEDKGILVEIDLTKELCVADEVEVILGDYEFVLKDSKTFFVKKKPQYPKTYAECCECLSLGEDSKLYTKGYKASLIQDFQKLLICRDAYWKIAGEQMGLNKSWEPDWNDTSIKYCLERDFDAINKNVSNHKGHTFAFPTVEMRDAFFDNFKDLVEQCKELL